MNESAYMRAVKRRVESAERFLDISTAIAHEEQRTGVSKDPRRVRDRAIRLRRRHMDKLTSITNKTGACIEEQALFEELRIKYSWLSDW